jgi:adenylyltransferase/sulfurtransferase
MAARGPHPVVPPEALRRIFAHAEREYPRECCGIVFGPRGEDLADDVKVCVNIQDELHAQDPELHARDAHTAYNLATADIFALQKSLRGERPAKIVYHSHANVGAYFSPTDQAAARFDDEPAYPVEYLVVDVQKDGAREAAQFAWDDERKEYIEIRRYGPPDDNRRDAEHAKAP